MKKRIGTNNIISENLIVLVAALVALGFAERYQLMGLYAISLVIAIFSSISVCYTLTTQAVKK